MMQEKNLLENNGQDVSQTGNSVIGMRNNELFEDIGDMGDDNEGRARFKEDDERLDLLKDIRKQQQIDIKGKQKKAAEKPNPENAKEGEVQNDAGETGETTADGNQEEDEKFLEEDTGSVASSTKSLMKHLRMLRNAIYENYSPPSIRNLNLNGRLVFVVLLILTIVWYVYSRTVYQ